MTKTYVKFQNDLHKTVGGVAHTIYLLLEGGGAGGAEPRYHGKPNTMSHRFSSKRRGTMKGQSYYIFTILCFDLPGKDLHNFKVLMLSKF